MHRILLSWLGRTDLRAATESAQVGIGPIAQAMATGRFSRLELLCDSALPSGHQARSSTATTPATPYCRPPAPKPAKTRSSPKTSARRGIIDRVARHYLEQAMQHTGGNKTRAARLLGLGSPTTLTNWLQKHGLEP